MPLEFMDKDLATANSGVSEAVIRIIGYPQRLLTIFYRKVSDLLASQLIALFFPSGKARFKIPDIAISQILQFAG